MRLEDISCIEKANVWLDSSILDCNRRFAKAPRQSIAWKRYQILRIIDGAVY
jgi:catabolite regulation protein CreA